MPKCEICECKQINVETVILGLDGEKTLCAPCVKNWYDNNIDKKIYSERELNRKYRKGEDE